MKTISIARDNKKEIAWEKSSVREYMDADESAVGPLSIQPSM